MQVESLYGISFLGSLLLSLLLVPIVRRVALRREVLDSPGLHKSHSAPVPYLGGLAMAAAFSTAVVVGTVLYGNSSVGGSDAFLRTEGWFGTGLSTMEELVLVLFLSLCLSLMGLIDDLRGLNPYMRLAIEVLASSALVGFGIQFQSPLPDGVDAIITVIWFVGITNAMNLMDNMDGLASGVASIAALTFFVIAIMLDQPLVALLSVGLAGCTLGFLRSNFNPASIYMGDAGSLFIGFLIAYLGLKLKVDETSVSQLLVPVVALGGLILDTTLVVFSRYLRGVHPLQGGRDHLSHRLMRFQFGVKRSVAAIFAFCLTLGFQAVALTQTSGFASIATLGSVISIFALMVVLLTRKSLAVDSRETVISDIRSRAN